LLFNVTQGSNVQKVPLVFEKCKADFLSKVLLWDFSKESEQIIIGKITLVCVRHIFVSQVEKKCLNHLLNIQVPDVFELDSAQQVCVDPLVWL
jgi:hypothetical protein